MVTNHSNVCRGREGGRKGGRERRKEGRREGGREGEERREKDREKRTICKKGGRDEKSKKGGAREMVMLNR